MRVLFQLELVLFKLHLCLTRVRTYLCAEHAASNVDPGGRGGLAPEIFTLFKHRRSSRPGAGTQIQTSKEVPGDYGARPPIL